MKRSAVLLALAGLAAMPLTGCAPVMPPPPVPVAIVPQRPHARAVWVAGRYRWSYRLHRYVWVPGYWRGYHPPRRVVVRVR